MNEPLFKYIDERPGRIELLKQLFLIDELPTGVDLKFQCVINVIEGRDGLYISEREILHIDIV